MNKNKGRVRNYIVTNKDIFCDFLAKTLCQLDISYVQIENEFHFDDTIYRFYNFNEYLNFQDKVIFMGCGDDSILSLNPDDLLFSKSKEELEKLFQPVQDILLDVPEVAFDDKRKNGFYSKQSIKYDNKMVKQKLRNSYRQNGFRNRRNG